MKIIKDLGLHEQGIDKRYGTVMRKRKFLFQCLCGATHELWGKRAEKQDTCKECNKGRTTHGEARGRLYNIHQGMKQRCTNPKSNKFHIYGVKGIKVDPQWASYDNFKEWAMSNGYDDTLTIDREDSSKDYTPSNCRWIPHSQNSAETTKVRAVVQWRKILKGGSSAVPMKVFTNGNIAAEELDLLYNHINRSCVRNDSEIEEGNVPKYSHGGFMWTYLDSLPNEWQDRITN